VNIITLFAKIRAWFRRRIGAETRRRISAPIERRSTQGVKLHDILNAHLGILSKIRSVRDPGTRGAYRAFARQGSDHTES
jgi:hypothetical protein